MSEIPCLRLQYGAVFACATWSMSTNPVSAIAIAASELFASVEPHSTVRDFAAIIEALGSTLSAEDDAQQLCVKFEFTDSEDFTHPTTAQKPKSSGRNAPKESEEEVASPAASPIPLVLSPFTPTVIEEAKLQSGEEALAV